MSSPVSVLPSARSKKGWGQQKQASGRRSTRECTSIVEGLKVIYYSKARPVPLAGCAWPRMAQPPLTVCLASILRPGQRCNEVCVRASLQHFPGHTLSGECSHGEAPCCRYSLDKCRASARLKQGGSMHSLQQLLGPTGRLHPPISTLMPPAPPLHVGAAASTFT